MTTSYQKCIFCEIYKRFFFRSMARSEHRVPGSWNDFHYTIDNALHVLMYMFICRGGNVNIELLKH